MFFRSYITLNFIQYIYNNIYNKIIFFKAPAAVAPASTESAPAKEEKKKEEPEPESDDDMGFGT